MRLHWIQHVPFEGLGHIDEWATGKGYSISVTKVFENTLFPRTDDIDLLVIMGGPMGVYDTDVYPWLAPEKEFIGKAINDGLKIIGICLGAQLIADVLGAKVAKNPEKEIGWFNINQEKGYTGLLKGIFENSPDVFHWHGDTFGIPSGSELVCSSEGCINQAFDYKGKVFGLQFHLETTPSSAQDIIKNCGDEIKTGGKYVQSEKKVAADSAKFERLNSIMENVFERIIAAS